MEWVSGVVDQTKGGVAAEESTETMAGTEIMATIVTGKTVEK